MSLRPCLYVRFGALQSCRFSSTTAPTLRPQNLASQNVLQTSAGAGANSVMSFAVPLRQIYIHSPRHSAIVLKRAFTTTAPSANSSTAHFKKPYHALTWDRFLRLRRIRRRFNLGSSLCTTLVMTAAGLTVIQAKDLDSLGAQEFGLDPIVVLGLMTIGFAAAGWLMGPVVGNRAFALRHRKEMKDMRMMEKEFYDRIKRYRVDPSNSSVQNPVPDYYGEKIGSVQDYRRWLKDQRVFNKKKESFM